jgi:hypothetical protein
VYRLRLDEVEVEVKGEDLSAEGAKVVTVDFDKGEGRTNKKAIRTKTRSSRTTDPDSMSPR